MSLSSTGTCVVRTLRGRNVIFAVLRKPCAQLVGVAELDVVAVIRVAVVVLADLEAVKRPGLQVLDGLLRRLLQLASRADAHGRRVHEIDVGGRDGPRPRSGRGVGLGLAGLGEVNCFFSGGFSLRREDVGLNVAESWFLDEEP